MMCEVRNVISRVEREVNGQNGPVAVAPYNFRNCTLSIRYGPLGSASVGGTLAKKYTHIVLEPFNFKVFFFFFLGTTS